MTSNKFIRLKIKKLLKQLPVLEIHYEYDDFSEAHFLKILPLNVFSNDNTYIKLEEEINNEFFEQYPFELITFLSENDNYEMLNAEKFISNKRQSVSSSFMYHYAIDSLLREYRIEIPTSINFTAPSSGLKYKNTYAKVLLHHKTEKRKAFRQVSVAETPILDIYVKEETSDISNNQDYSLAA